MLLKTAVRIIVHEKEKFAGAVFGVTIAVFLMLLQWGFYLGFQRDITGVLDAIDADIWVVAKNQPQFDGYAVIDDLPYGILREHPDVERVGRVVWGWAAGRLPKTGGLDMLEVLGFELESGIALHFRLPEQDLTSLVGPDGHVLLGKKDHAKLGISEPGALGMEINGLRAVPVGFIPQVRLFSTASFVLTDLDNARTFLRMPPAHATYLVCKCRPGAAVRQVVADLQRAIPEHDVLTSQQFHDKAAKYWTERTSIGPLLLLYSVLAVAVSFLIVILAFYLSTAEKIPVFACMKALGASDGEIMRLLVFQSAVVFAIGSALAGLALYVSVAVLAQTTITVVITKNVVLTGLGANAVASLGSSLLAVRRVLRTDPGEAFRT